MKKRITRSVVPNLLTLGNLFSGFTALVHISNNELVLGAIFIFIAAVFDMLDGLTARLINATSELGAELDSLCDAVSFGVAPAFMLYNVYFYQIGDYGILLASLPALAGVLRLARFNVLLSSFEDKLYFRGMPIPAAALTIISYIILWFNNNILGSFWAEILLYVIVVIVPFSMVSNIKFDNLPRPNRRSFQERPFVFVLFIAAIVGTIASKGLLIFPFMMFYIIASAIRHFIKWLSAKQMAIDEFDETIEDDDD